MQENRSFDTYFGTFPGADGIPMKNGTPVACFPIRAKRVHAPVSRYQRSQSRRSAQRSDRRTTTSTAARWTDSSRRRRTRVAVAAIPTRRTAPAPRTSSVITTAADSQLLALRARLRAARSALRAERVVESAAASLHGFGVVGEMHAAGRPHDVHQRLTASRLSARLRSAQPARAPGRPSGLRVDRSHVSFARASSELGVLRDGRRRARLRDRCR